MNSLFNLFKSPKNLKITICIFLVVSTFSVYSQVQDHGILNYDDYGYVKENKYVRAGLTGESMAWAFTTPYLSEWAPINMLSYMLDYQLFGSNPKGFHLTNLFFHLANVLLLFLVLCRMTGAVWKSCFVAALFALHPFNVESVAWIAERKNVLSTFFWFLTMWAYVYYVEKPSIKSYGLVAIFLALGLMTKAMLITLPFVLLLLDYWPLRRWNLGESIASPGSTENSISFLRLVLEKLPLFALVAGCMIVNLKAIEVLGSLDSFPLQDRVVNALVSYLLYLKMMIWPSGFSIFYPYPVNDLPVWKGLVCGLILLSISIGVLRYLRQAPYLAVGWFWYLGALVPVIGIVQAGEQAMADRYAYVTLIGIFIMIAWGLPDLLAKWRNRDRILIVLAAIYFPLLMGVTWNQVSHWKNNITIFEQALKVTENNNTAHNNLGIALRAGKKTQEAIHQFKKAIENNPSFANAYNNLGNALFDEQKYEEAIVNFKSAIKLNPDFAKAYNNLGNALWAKQKNEEAIYNLQTAIKLESDYADPHYNLGNVLFTQQRYVKAIAHYKMAIKLKPNFPLAQNNLKAALRQLEGD